MSPEQIAEALRGYVRQGPSHGQLWLSPRTIEGIAWLKAVLILLDRG